MEPCPRIGVARSFGEIKLAQCASRRDRTGPPFKQKATWALAGGVAWWLQSRGKGHCPRRLDAEGDRRRLHAESDSHSAVVRAWLQEFIIGKNFCPWAKSASDSEGIRVVTSQAATEDEILRDLEEEVMALPSSLEVPRGVPSTTLLVCPHVPSWSVGNLIGQLVNAHGSSSRECASSMSDGAFFHSPPFFPPLSPSLCSCAHEDFAEFNEFYGKVLQNGVLFEDNFNVKVVAFHPEFVQSPLHPSLQRNSAISSVERHGPRCKMLTARSNKAKEKVLRPQSQQENGTAAILLRFTPREGNQILNRCVSIALRDPGSGQGDGSRVEADCVQTLNWVMPSNFEANQ
eukprot:Skav208474  [mRNA]  locus=scaffold1104:344466:348024:- [translate_table: standard]